MWRVFYRLENRSEGIAFQIRGGVLFKHIFWAVTAIAVTIVAWFVWGIYKAERLFDTLEAEYEADMGIPRGRSAWWN